MGRDFRQHPNSFDAELHRHSLAPLTARIRPARSRSMSGRCATRPAIIAMSMRVRRAPRRWIVASRERVIELLARSPSIEIVDITGGAPELNSILDSSSSRRAARAATSSCDAILRSSCSPGWIGCRRFIASIACGWSVRCRATPPRTWTNNAAVESSIRVSQALRLLNDLGYGMPDADADA